MIPKRHKALAGGLIRHGCDKLVIYTHFMEFRPGLNAQRIVPHGGEHANLRPESGKVRRKIERRPADEPLGRVYIPENLPKR